MKKLTLSIISIILFFTLKAQGDYDYEETEDYDWNKFDSDSFLTSALISVGIIALGIIIGEMSKSNLLKKIGSIIAIIGGLYALISLGGTVLAAFGLLMQIVVPLAIAVLVLYLILDAVQKKKEENERKKGKDL